MIYPTGSFARLVAWLHGTPLVGGPLAGKAPSTAAQYVSDVFTIQQWGNEVFGVNTNGSKAEAAPAAEVYAVPAPPTPDPAKWADLLEEFAKDVRTADPTQIAQAQGGRYVAVILPILGRALIGLFQREHPTKAPAKAPAEPKEEPQDKAKK